MIIPPKKTGTCAKGKGKYKFRTIGMNSERKYTGNAEQVRRIRASASIWAKRHGLIIEAKIKKGGIIVSVVGFKKINPLEKRTPQISTLRIEIHKKYGGRCAYCGEEIEVEKMHVDHFRPLYRKWDNRPRPSHAGEDTPDNMMPSCRICNSLKAVYTIDEFRAEIEAQVARARSRSSNFRVAEKYGQIQDVSFPVVFWFERFEKSLVK